MPAQDTKITALAAITTVDPANDMLPIVDVSDNSMAASGTTKRITSNQILGAGGTATLASATITGDLTVNTNVLKVDTTNDRVIVGHTSGSSAFQVTNAGAAGLEIQPTGVNSNPVILSYNRSTSAYGQLTLDGASVVHNISGSTGLTLNSTSNLVLKGGTAGANGVGLTFPATQVVSSDANCLDDYEEGTWTIGLTFGGGNTGINTTGNTGRYTKVGRQVTVSGILSLSNKGSSTGIAEITGLPFTIANANEAYSAANVRFNGISFADVPICIGATNSTKIILQEITNAGVVTDLTDADFTNTSSCVISFTYTV